MSSALGEPQLLLIEFKLRLPAVPQTIEQALFAVARLGGHLKNNGAPGWQALGRGYQKFLDYEIGFRAARSLTRSDQPWALRVRPPDRIRKRLTID